MILGRLNVRERVNLLALLPLMLVIALSVPLVAARLDDARAAAETAQAATTAGGVSKLIEHAQEVRLLAIAYQAKRGTPPNAVTAALQSFSDERARLADLESGQARPDLARQLEAAKGLEGATARVLARDVTGTDVLDLYGSTINGLIDAVGLTGNLGVHQAAGVDLNALDALLRSDEADSRRSAALLLALSDTVSRNRAQPAVQELEIVESAAANEFVRASGPQSGADLARVQHSLAALRLAAGKIWLLRSPNSDPASADARIRTAEVFAAAQDQMHQRRFLTSAIIRDLSRAATDNVRTARLVTVALALVGLSVLGGVVVLSIVVGRSVSRPLRRLTTAAGRVADLAQEELLKVADEDATEAHIPRLAAIDIRTEDEIGDLAAAFNRVQTTAALLLERQVTSRRNVASMFASMGRRTSNLVNRQLALIDTLEREEEDPDTLATLFRLDHTATRLRRNANSLVVLSGGSESLGEGQPVPLGDVVRAALGTVEDYQRVELRRLPKVWISPGVIGDLALLLAELLDNAVSFSPPRTQVEVVATMSQDGTCAISVVDHGMGIPAARMAQENSRLHSRERLDLAPSDVLGLFVVGRIARRHRIAVRLAVTPPSGVTALVTLPPTLMVDGRAPTADRPGAAPDARAHQADAAAAATRRQLVARAGGDRTARPGGTAVPIEVPAATSASPAPVSEHGADSALPQRVRRARPGARPGFGDVVPPAPIPPAPIPPPPPGGEGIARRVPGAHLAGLDVTVPADAEPVTSGLRIDPESVRRQVLDVERAVDRAHLAAQGIEPEPPAPPIAELARRSGINRRIPGAALASLDGAAPPHGDAPGGRRRQGVADPGEQIDAERLRTELDAVDDALHQASATAATDSITTERVAAQAALAARRAAAGADPTTSPAPVAKALRAADVPAAAADVPAAAGDPAEGSATLTRRVRGASLSAFVPAGAVPRHAAGPSSTKASRPGQLVAVPERPEDVLAWASDLEATLARLPAPGGGATRAGDGSTDHDGNHRP